MSGHLKISIFLRQGTLSPLFCNSVLEKGIEEWWIFDI